MNTRVKGFVYLLLSAVYFGFMPLLVKVICADGSTIVGALFLRFALAIIPLYIYLKVRKVPMELSVEEEKKILCVTVFGYGITALLLYSAYDYMPSGMATVIHFGYPVFVLLGSLIFLRRRVPKLKIVCVGLCMIGIFLSYAGSGGEAKPMGFVFALISGMTYAFYILYLEVGGLQDIPAMKMIFYMNIVGSIMVFFDWKSIGEFCASYECKRMDRSICSLSWRSIYRSGIFSVWRTVCGSPGCGNFKYI